MEFVKEFAVFLHKIQAIKFGDYTLASGKKSSYYVDLRLVLGHPHQFRKMTKYLQDKISDMIGLDSFDSFVSVPTGGLAVASALAIETVKPLIYVRTKSKDYGTSKVIEGDYTSVNKVLMIDDVATTGGSVLGAIKSLKNEKLDITDAFVIVDRMEGATQNLAEQGVKLHSITNVVEIAKILHEEKLVSDDIMDKVREQTS